MNRFWAIFIKEILQIRRDPLSLCLLLLVPAFLLILYGYALSYDVKHLKVAVLDEDRTPQSRFLLDSLFQNPYFDRAGTISSRAAADHWLKRGDARIVLVIPHDFAARLALGRKSVVQALIDGSDAMAGTVAVGYLDALAEKITAQLKTDGEISGHDGAWPSTSASENGGARAACPEHACGELAEPVERIATVPWNNEPIPSQHPYDRISIQNAGGLIKIEPRIWFNPDLQSAHFLIPGLMGMLLMLSAVIATSLSIVREKERETIEQINVSAVRPFELILGKIMPYLLICLVTALIVLGVGYFVFGLAIRGSPFLLGGAILIFLFAALGMGLLISAATKSQQVAFQVATISSLLPSIVLSGLIFPISSMPLPIQGVTLIVVPRYFVSVMRSIILKDASLSDIWPNLAAMIVLGLIFNLLAIRIMGKTK